ncbi:hypothetical protein GCM10009839_02390 [Catenulispora yoronensis]|uniref:Uncharacterized protein n=1 Tax=Catenulispora yoronensis TaxID=450799 RepID=A0ABN2TJY8_9ACTN
MLWQVATLYARRGQLNREDGDFFLHCRVRKRRHDDSRASAADARLTVGDDLVATRLRWRVRQGAGMRQRTPCEPIPAAATRKPRALPDQETGRAEPV